MLICLKTNSVRNYFFQPITRQTSGDVDYDDIESANPINTVKIDTKNKDSTTKDNSTDNDKQLMPPPSIPLKSQIRYNKRYFLNWNIK